jgi:hypothetical protein
MRIFNLQPGVVPRYRVQGRSRIHRPQPLGRTSNPPQEPAQTSLADGERRFETVIATLIKGIGRNIK